MECAGFSLSIDRGGNFLDLEVSQDGLLVFKDSSNISMTEVQLEVKGRGKFRMVLAIGVGQ